VQQKNGVLPVCLCSFLQLPGRDQATSTCCSLGVWSIQVLGQRVRRSAIGAGSGG
jgi:hypothetical protein